MEHHVDGSPLLGVSFDHYCRLVRRFLDVPVALVTIVEPDRQVFPGSLGLPEPWASRRETPLTHSFCQHVVAERAPLVVSDARRDPRLLDNLAIDDLGVVAYAGWPLTNAAGQVVGSLCAIGPEPREWSASDLAGLEDLAQACSAEIQHVSAQAAAGVDLARAMVDAAEVALALYDDGGRLLLANARAEALAVAAGFDLDVAPHAGTRVVRADRREAVPAEEQMVPRALRGALRHPEVQWLGAGDGQVAVVASGHALTLPDGREATLLVAHDVTELAHSLEVRERFSATVSHELRTPLTAILGFTEMLADEVDGSAARLVQRIRGSATTLQDRVTDILADAGRRGRLDLRATDLHALVTRAAETLASPAAQRGATLRVAGEETWATLDPGRVERAVENLLSNAIKYGPEGGAVDVEVRRGTDRVEVVVADEGRGLTPEEVERAFELYWRADSARTADVPGSGIGLPLVREIASEHRGSVRMESRPGRGTTVTLTLPRVPA
ncbi:GAF domain-containing sensor histidine kinase [Nocardioides sp. CFH 31398]|uniref:sensor histidine kinase n=1 Tax=Nocardioides sp. CFH 31398 TaxID=2919579 RepID=UPI001F06CE6E|nr:GAF domain-containing sensor histidine kinase [Nocardioides sp. CFH 31398]MCH1865323.1 GAF domain-containing sensor histidine kinase [Nocardioides sp. CFH 31398]